MKRVQNRLVGFYLLLVASIAAATGCQQSEVDSISLPALGSATLVAQTAEQTRVSISDNTLLQAIQVTWSADDSFSLYDSAGAYVCRFDYSGEDSASQGEFTAASEITLIDGSSYTALYPYLEGDESLSLAERQAQTTIATLTQSQNSDISHLNDALRMSTEFSYSDSSVITFEHDLSILKISFPLSDGATPTELTFADGSVSYTLNYSSDITASDSYTSYMAILPSPTNSGERNLSFTLTTSAGGEPLTYSYPTTADLVAGRCYTASILVFGAAERTLADFSEASFPDSDIWKITDTSAELENFYGLYSALSSCYSEGREISLIFPNLTEIPSASAEEYGALYMCRALVSVDLPAVISVGDYAFARCFNLVSIDMPMVTSIGTNVFINCSYLTSIKMPAVTTLGNGALYYCYAITSIDLPKVTSVGNFAFNSCKALTSVNMPSVTSIDYFAFSYCEALVEMSLATDDGVILKSIGSSSSAISTTSAFYDAPTENITLTLGSANSDNVSGNTLTVGRYSATFKEILYNDIERYTTLAEFAEDGYPTDSDTWTITDAAADLDAFYGLRDALYSAYDEGRKISLIFPNLTEFPESSYIYNCAFYRCNALVSISLPLVTEVGSRAFYYCESLTSVNLPLATSVGDYAFYNCNALYKVSLATGNGVQLSSLGAFSAFYNAPTESITLTLGSENSIFVSGNNILTVGDVSETFEEIIVL